MYVGGMDLSSTEACTYFYGIDMAYVCWCEKEDSYGHRLADLCLCNAYYTRRRRREKRPSVAYYQKTNESVSGKGESFTFLFVGRIVGDKGINELCLAFNRLHVQYPKTKLWLVGAFEEKLDPVKAETRTLIENKDNGN